MNYYLKVSYKKTSFNASYKPSQDGYIIAERQGYKAISISDWGNNKLLSKLNAAIEIIRILIVLKSTDRIFIQYPIYTPLKQYLLKAISWRTKHIYILIHDLDSLRSTHKIKENPIISKAEVVIVHSEKMKEFVLKEFTPIGEIRILHLFDYLTNDRVSPISNKNVKEIVYAGNLANNTFLTEFSNNLTSPQTLLVYGKEESWMKEQKYSFIYKGTFSPNNINQIEGYWGLLWYGDSIFKCTGLLGEYMKYISPHKVSLYLATQKPVIISKDSALAEYIEQNKLGITVENLLEVEDKIKSLTDIELELIKKNVEMASIELRNGKFLGKYL